MAPQYSARGSGYQPLMSPEQQRQYELARYLNQNPQQGTMSYSQWLESRGYQQPGQQQGGMSMPSSSPDMGGFDSLFSSGGSAEAGNALASSGASEASSLAADAGANAAYNSAAMEAGGNPMTLAEIPNSAEAAGAFDFSGIGGAGNAILPMAGAVGIYDVWKNKRRGARGIGQGAASGAAIGSYFGPWGTGIGAVLGGAYGAMQHKSTRDYAKDHTTYLQGLSSDPQWQNYLHGVRDQYNSAPSDPSKPFHGGQYGSWEEYKAAGLDAGDLTGVHGNLKVNGPKWASLSEDQRRAMTQKYIDANLYTSKKGEVEFTDEAKAKQMFDEAMANPSALMQSQNMNPIPRNTKIMIPRSSTRSPGFDKNGKRINYN